VKYFIDTKFIEKPNTIQLISIGIKCEDGREYHAISKEYNYFDADEWVKENVIMSLYTHTVEGNFRVMYREKDFHKEWGKSIKQIKKEIIAFVDDDAPEFWGYYADYDWVVFCWIFGKMIDLPRNFPMYCRDIKQLADTKGNPKFEKPKDEHNALADANWNERYYNFLIQGTQ
jgi:hypothetical protein